MQSHQWIERDDSATESVGTGGHAEHFSGADCGGS